VSVRFAERYSANLLVELRFEDDISQLGTLIARPWLAVRPLPWLDLAVGYDYIPRFEPISVDQHVVWEQVALSRGFGRLDIDNRFRFEQRFIEHVDEVALRIRNRIRVTHPLGETRWYAVGQDEIFFQLNTLGPVIRSGFAENRVFVGLGRRLGDHAHIEAGYRLRYIDVPVLDDVIHHVIGISFGFDAELP
jgi:hypothetical protein